MKQSDILFVHANGSEKIYQALAKNNSAIEPPIWAAMLANHCRGRGFAVELLDCEAERLDYEASVSAIKDAKARVVCFVVYGQQPSASTQNMEGATAVARRLKQESPSTKLLFVGGHIAALPREVMETEEFIDFVCQNEGVYTISSLLDVQDLGDETQLRNVQGLGYRNKDQRVVLNEINPIVPQAKLETDLPGMAWDLLPDIKKYRTAGWHSWSNNAEKSPFGALYTSLGCPYKCSFCMINIINRTDPSPEVAADSSSIFRYWSPEFTIKQFDTMAKLGVKNVKIADELFVLNPKHFIALCDLLIERDYRFNIWAYARIDSCRPQYLEKLKAAGVNWLGLGIENPNQTLRREITKSSFEELKIAQVIHDIQAAGIAVGGNYIFGLPMDTHESMRDTLNFALDHLTDMGNFYTAMAYPGSPLHLMARKKNWKLPGTYVGYSQHAYETENLPNDHLSAAEILKFRDEAWMKYHTDPRFLSFMEKKYGANARVELEQTTKVQLKRQLLAQPAH